MFFWCCIVSSLAALFTKASQQARLKLFAVNKVSLRGLKTPKISKVGDGLFPLALQFGSPRIKAVGALQMQLAGFSVGPNA